MIGDNPDSDIDGANRRGEKWVSILVRTGVFQGGANSDKHAAKYVAQDMEEAVQLIFRLEGLEFVHESKVLGKRVTRENE
jgi:ribonucleotide monophosphatase NagD (HAD superfamily)